MNFVFVILYLLVNNFANFHQASDEPESLIQSHMNDGASSTLPRGSFSKSSRQRFSGTQSIQLAGTTSLVQERQIHNARGNIQHRKMHRTAPVPEIIQHSSKPFTKAVAVTITAHDCYIKPSLKSECDSMKEKAKKFYPRTDVMTSSQSNVLDIKFFKESKFSTHLDLRFGRFLPSPNSKDYSIRKLHEAWVKFTTTYNLVSWLAHGTLLSWFWSQSPFPWDDDIDLQVLLSDLQSKYIHFDREVFENRYLFEINPNSACRQNQPNNIIDARFIDQETGYFIDITALRATEQQLQCKTPHTYSERFMFPLRKSHYMGSEVWIPNRAVDVLLKEYGSSSLSNENFSVKGKSYIFHGNAWS